ncbi:MAG: 30S ribosome-binding factor RbfA [Bacillota bacterium]|nr:30S ribosome-binding factor RbfA [Bacillota bacterium]
MAKYRYDRIGEELKREISDILQNEIKDPGLGFVSIILVEVSGDLRQAKVYYSVMGDEDSIRSTKEVMKRCSGFIRREIANRLALRYTPELVFIYDDSIEHGIRIAQIINDENAKQEKRNEKE